MKLSKIPSVVSKCSKFQLERNKSIICENVNGFFCSNDYPNSIQVLDDVSVVPNEEDWIIHNDTQKRYFIDNVKPLPLGSFILHYQTEYEYNQIQNAQNASINIGTIHGPAIVGNQKNAIINIECDFDKIKDSLLKDETINNNDKKEVELLIDRLKTITEENQPISKGVLGRFSDLLAKHSNIVVAIAGPLISWLTGK